MPVLALDTSADIAVCLVADPAPGATDPYLPVLAERRSPEHRRHAELLTPLVAEVLAEAGCAVADVTRVVVGTGPAPFTGLRAGLVTARTFAFARGIPVDGVCSLDALAAQAVQAGFADADVLVLSDARRRELYVARYRAGGGADVDVVEPPAVLHPADVVQALEAAPASVVGPGTGLYPGLDVAPGAPTALDPAVLARLAAVRAARGTALPTEPLYLRRPDVHPAAARKRATG